MKLITIGLIFSLLAVSTEAEQRRRKTPPRPAKQEEPKTTAPMVGAPIVIVTKNGDHIKGEMLDLTAFSVRLKSGKLESTIALDTITAISFDPSAVPASQPEKAEAPMHADFGGDADRALSEFQSAAAGFKADTDYTTYGRQLTDLRRTADRFVGKYSASENETEARVVALLAGSVTDYTWARTIWTLKLGRTGDGTVSESDSPAVGDAIALYPDLREMVASGNKLSGDKLIAGLWQKAAEKIDRARSTLAGPR